MLINYPKVLKNSAFLCLCLMALVGCQTKTVYVDRIVEVPIKTPAPLMKECDIPKRDGNLVVDYIVSESRLHNALVICNRTIQERNKYEKMVAIPKEK